MNVTALSPTLSPNVCQAGGVALAALPLDTASGVLATLSHADAGRLLSEVPAAIAANVVDAMALMDAAKVLVLMPHATVAAICAQLQSTDHLLIAIRNASKKFKEGLKGLDLQEELEKQIESYRNIVQLLQDRKVRVLIPQGNGGVVWKAPSEGGLCV